MIHSGQKLIERLNQKPLLNVGVYDAISAATAAHYPQTEGLFLSGLAYTYAHYGWPDIGLVESSDIRECARIIRNNHPNLFLTCDIDSGLGGIEQLRRTCVDLKNLGVAAVQLEDQTQEDKRCGHISGKVVRPFNEAVERFRVAQHVAAPMQIIARTDAPMRDGESLSRIDAFILAGAKIVLVDGIGDDDLPEVVSTVNGRAHIMANIVGGGKLKQRPAQEFYKLGISIVNLSTPLIFPAMSAMKRTMERMIKADWSLSEQDGEMTLSQANQFVTKNYGDYTAASKEIAANQTLERPCWCERGQCAKKQLDI